MEMCPCCGFQGLDQKPYANMPSSMKETRNKPVPYENLWGEPSYDVCSCCGYEFGFDDNPGNGPGTSFEDHLQEWIADGCKWLVPSEKPEDWSLETQLNSRKR